MTPTGDGDRDSRPPTPRWVKVAGVVTVVVVLLVALMLVSGGGSHGPGRHIPSDADGRRTPPGATEDHPRTSSGDGGGHRPPPGAH